MRSQSQQSTGSQQIFKKPFKFKDGIDGLNEEALKNFDPDQLFEASEIDEANVALKNFLTCSIPEKMQFDLFSKLFRLAQLGLRFYASNQGVFQTRIDKQQSEIQSLQARLISYSEIKLKHSEQLAIYSEQVKNLEKKATEMKEECEKMGAYKCIYCSKFYLEKEMLIGHLKRRHADILGRVPETDGSQFSKEQSQLFKAGGLLRKTVEEEQEEHAKKCQELIKNLEKRIVEKGKVPERKLVEDISKKLNAEFDKKISKYFEKIEKESIMQKEQQQREESSELKTDSNENKDEEMQNKRKIAESLLQINSTLTNFQLEISRIQETQNKITQAHLNHNLQLSRIKQDQEEIKSSPMYSVPSKDEVPILDKPSRFLGPIISSKQAPSPLKFKSLDIRIGTGVNTNSQPLGTANFLSDQSPQKTRFFQKSLQDSDLKHEDNNNVNRNRKEVEFQKRRRRSSQMISEPSESESNSESETEERKDNTNKKGNDFFNLQQIPSDVSVDSEKELPEPVKLQHVVSFGGSFRDHSKDAPAPAVGEQVDWNKKSTFGKQSNTFSERMKKDSSGSEQ